jgi:hypothetical protein
LRLVWLGGMAILEALRRIQFNIFADRPVIGRFQKMKILLAASLPKTF